MITMLRPAVLAFAVAAAFTGAHASQQADKAPVKTGELPVRPADPTKVLPSDTGAQTTLPSGAVTGAGQPQGTTIQPDVGLPGGLEQRARTQERRETTTTDARARAAWERTHRASKIIGTDVYNRQGEKLGDIKDVVIDPQTGNVSYAVVSFGGFLGIGDRLFAVPWKALQVDNKRPAFVLDATKEKLRQAQGFDPNKWPNMADARWQAEVYRFYGQDMPARGATGAEGAGKSGQVSR